MLGKLLFFKSQPMSELVKISELAEITGLSVRAIRFYETIGLVKKENKSGPRVFKKDQTIRHLKLIQYLRSCNFSLEEIGITLDQKLNPSTDFRPKGINFTFDDAMARLDLLQDNIRRIQEELTSRKGRSTSN